MSIWITGDIHGNPIRLNDNIFYEQEEFSGNKDDNVVIILGDFGLIWDREKENEREKQWLDWLEDKPFTTVFLDGNHECFPRIYKYPIKTWSGGQVHEIRPHVLHLIRGEVFIIENLRFFAFGGAQSHDISDGILDPDKFNNYEDFHREWVKWDNEHKLFRVKGYTWWSEELPTIEEMQHGWDNLERYDFKVDYILSHTPPASTISLLGHGLYEQDILSKYLEEVRQTITFKKHFMGHMHLNKQLNNTDILLYEQIIQIH